jgi:hypothetical protein
MFFPGSRYTNTGRYTFTTRTGAVVTATYPALPQGGPLLGNLRRFDGQRLDLIADTYLNDPTAFWQLCDANGSILPDALASHGLVSIPGSS